MDELEKMLKAGWVVKLCRSVWDPNEIAAIAERDCSRGPVAVRLHIPDALSALAAKIKEQSK